MNTYNNGTLLRNLPTRIPATKHCRVQNAKEAFTELYGTEEKSVTANIGIARVQEYDEKYDDYVTCDYAWQGHNLNNDELKGIYMFKNPSKPKGKFRIEGIKDNPFFLRGNEIYEIRRENGNSWIWLVNIVASEAEVRLIAESLGIENPFIELARPFKSKKTGRILPVVQWVVMGKDIPGFCFIKAFPVSFDMTEATTLPFEEMKCFDPYDKIEHNGEWYDVVFEKRKGLAIR